MILHAPQLIWIVLTSMGVAVSLYHHNEPRTGEYNFFVDIVVSLLNAGLLYWGGFFG